VKKYIVYRALIKKNGIEYIYYGSTSKTLDEIKKYWHTRSRYDQLSKMLELCYENGADAFDWSIVDTATSLKESDMKRVLLLRYDLSKESSTVILNRTKGLIPIEKKK